MCRTELTADFQVYNAYRLEFQAKNGDPAAMRMGYNYGCAGTKLEPPKPCTFDEFVRKAYAGRIYRGGFNADDDRWSTDINRAAQELGRNYRFQSMSHIETALLKDWRRGGYAPILKAVAKVISDASHQGFTGIYRRNAIDSLRGIKKERFADNSPDVELLKTAFKDVGVTAVMVEPQQITPGTRRPYDEIDIEATWKSFVDGLTKDGKEISEEERNKLLAEKKDEFDAVTDTAYKDDENQKTWQSYNRITRVQEIYEKLGGPRASC